MILIDLYSFLKNDAELTTILGATESNPRIMPNITPAGSEPPFITYRSLNAGGTGDAPLGEELVVFEITADLYWKLLQVSGRLNELMDMAPPMTIPSSEWKIHYSKQTGGTDFADEIGRHIRAVNYIFKFSKKGD